MSDAVELQDVSKSFGKTPAVADLSVRVPLGTVYGFIGPNGSGKTTTLRMIMRIHRPERGRVIVLGDAEHGPADDRVAYLPEERGLYRQMKVRDVLRFYAKLKSHTPAPGEIENWLRRLDLPDVADKRVETLSKGMSQKVQFIAAVISKPQLVLLDEPFSGLDPVNAAVLRDLIIDLRREGATIIFSTHDMAVAEKMCDRIFMIHRGRKVLDGTLADIQREHGSDTVRVQLSHVPTGSLHNVPHVTKVTDFGRYQELRVEPHTDPAALLAALMQLGTVTRFELSTPSLQEIFVRMATPDADPAATLEAVEVGA